MTEIVTIPDGEAVPGNGAYRMSLTHYHTQQCCPGPSVSSSGLRRAWNEGLWAFWSQSDMNPNRYPPRDPSDALILGRAAHALILGDEVFDDVFAYVPGDAPKRPTSTQVAAFEKNGYWSDAAKDGAAWWAEFDAKAAGRTLLTETQVGHIVNMAENLRRNPLAVQMLTGGMTEVSLIWQDEATGLWVKARPDVLPDNGADAADLKTFSRKGSNLSVVIQRAITDNGYAQQMALAQEGTERVFGVSATEFVLVFVETTVPYEVVTVRLDEEALHLARIKNRHALDQIARGLETGEWPFRIPDLMNYTVPPSEAERIYTLQAAGELPSIERLTS